MGRTTYYPRTREQFIAKFEKIERRAKSTVEKLNKLAKLHQTNKRLLNIVNRRIKMIDLEEIQQKKLDHLNGVVHELPPGIPQFNPNEWYDRYFDPLDTQLDVLCRFSLDVLLPKDESPDNNNNTNNIEDAT